jgi:pimeloyl-ACP methyl ester carboxylesterase
MSVQARPTVASKIGSPSISTTRRGFILTATAATACASIAAPNVARAAVVQTDTAGLPPLPLSTGIRSRYVGNINGLTFHVLEAGFETKGRPCVLLLHGYPELAYGWRKVMLLLASAGFHVIAPDMRGYGRTTGWDDSYDGDVFLFRHTNLVRDALGLVSAFGYHTAAVVGRDAGSPVAAYCALIRPDVFRSVAMMTSPFAGPPVTYSGRTIDVPSLFIGGKSDWGVFQTPGAFERMQSTACTKMRGAHLIDGAGHWLEQEQPEQVSKLLIEFIQSSA